MGTSLGLALGVGLAALLVTSPHLPGLPDQRLAMPIMLQEADAPLEKEGLLRTSVRIPHDESNIHGWLYTPTKSSEEGAAKPPITILVHGFGATKESDLGGLAEELTKRGIAALAIDFLRWGFSDGAPRHVANPHKQLREYETVLRFIVDSKGFGGKVDSNRIAVYGASLGGGLTLALAGSLAKKKSDLLSKLKAAFAAVPMVSGHKSSVHSFQKQSKASAIRASLLIGLDAMRAVVPNVTPLYFYGIARKADSKVAFLPLGDDEYEEWRSRVAPLLERKNDAWANKIAARSALHVSSFSPEGIITSCKLQTPTFIFAGSKDTVVPLRPIQDLAKKLKESGAPVTFEEWGDADHFSFIGSSQIARFADLMAGFFKQHFA